MRTPEQVAADDALTAAIQATNRAYFDPEPNILTDYIVIFAEQGIDADGDGETTITLLTRDNEIPLYRIIGLLDTALAQRRRFALPGAD